MPRIAVILGAGPGTGASVARFLSKTHSLLLLSPSLPGSLPKLQLSSASDVLAVSSNGSRESLMKAFDEMKYKWPDGVVDVGVCNTGSGASFKPGSFLDQTDEAIRESTEHGL
jgi:hypothetical protein